MTNKKTIRGGFKEGYSEGFNKQLSKRQASTIRWLILLQIIVFILSLKMEIPKYLVWLPTIFIIGVLIRFFTGLKKNDK